MSHHTMFWLLLLQIKLQDKMKERVQKLVGDQDKLFGCQHSTQCVFVFYVVMQIE